MEKKVAVLITSYNRKETTAKCLDSLFNCKKNHGFLLKIFLVDDKCPDQTGKHVKFLFPKVNVIYGSGDLYWNRGMILAWNEALRNDDFDFFIWLNDDTFLFKNAIKMLFDSYYKVNEDCIVVASTKDPKDGDFSYGGRDSNGNPIIPNGDLQESKIINGNLVLVSKKTVDKIGILSKKFSHSLGDIDYGLRAYEKGIRSYILPDYAGYCLKNNNIDWNNPKKSLFYRLAQIGKPNSIVLKEHYYFHKRHVNQLSAFMILIKIIVKVLMPKAYKMLTEFRT